MKKYYRNLIYLCILVAISALGLWMVAFGETSEAFRFHYSMVSGLLQGAGIWYILGLLSAGDDE